MEEQQAADQQQQQKEATEELPTVEEDPSNATLGQDEPQTAPPKKRKRDPEDTGDKGQAADGHKAPVLPKSEGGPSDLKRIRDMTADSREGLLDIMEKFKDSVAEHATAVLNRLAPENKDRAERITNLMEIQSKLTPEDWLSQLSNMTVYLLHMAGLHNKLVDNVLMHMGLVMEDLGPTMEDAIKLYEELTQTTKHLCAVIHSNTQ